jgi:hypothetical protein
MPYLRIIALILGLVTSASCADLPTACTSDPENTVLIEVRDSRTGAPLAFGSTGVIEDGDYIEPLTSLEGTPFLWAGKPEARPGTYRITIARPGYRLWQRDNVRVNRDRCGVRTVELDAHLLSE